MCKIANLSKDPFITFSAEEELEILNQIFYKPSFYSGMKSQLESGSSRFILGKRGQGKSSIIRKLNEDLIQSGCMPVVIDRYDGMPLEDNTAFFYYKIVQAFTLELASRFVGERLNINDIPETLRNKFYVLSEMFYDTQWAPLFMEDLRSIKSKKQANCIKKFFNRYLLGLVNGVLDGTVQLTGSLMRRAIMGKDVEFDYDAAKKQYFSGFSISEFETFKLSDANKIGIEEYKLIIDVLMSVLKCTHLKSVIIMFDGVDEYKLLDSNVNDVAKFMKGILMDTSLLYTQRFGIVFSIWSEVKRSLEASSVRFDKFPTIDIRWNEADLESIINKRLLFYSENKEAPVTLGSLVTEEIQKDEMLKISDGSPRYLIWLLGKIRDSESRERIVSFSPEAISKGMKKFCMDFDYGAERAVKPGGKTGVKDWVNKLLAVRTDRFTNAEYANAAGVGVKVARKHIEDCLKLKFVHKGAFPGKNGADLFIISDSRIKYLMATGVTSLD